MRVHRLRRILVISWHVVAGVAAGGCVSPPEALDAVEQSIRTSLPLGSSEHAVERFLRSRGEEPWVSDGGRVIVALFRQHRVGVVSEEARQFTFRFDRRQRLTSLQVKELYTGL